ncbi:hypothetical protein QEN19_002562 [Hanseniaspora menglaensis]
MYYSNLVIASLFAALFSSITKASDLPSIEIKGNKFFNSNNGSQFYIRGVAYQADSANATSDSTITDPLADYTTCSRDIPYLQELNTNVIRVYALNVTQNHTQCMQALNDAGIYLIADLSIPGESIDRDSPAWTVELFERYKSVVDEFHSYSNVLGFFAGNEVSNAWNNTDASAFVKAAIRDTKAYISEKGYRSIPVGYSSNDDSVTRLDMAEYFACGESSEAADFYGINMYEWCGDSSFKTSGYQARTAEFANYTIPLFMSEYGCNTVTPRVFTEIAALFSDEMTDVWSGGIVYMYYQESNNYGLVTIDSSGDVSTMADYKYYSSEINSVSPSSTNSNSYTPSTTSMTCPTIQSSTWLATTVLPPTPNTDLCECAYDSLSCVVDSSVSDDDYADLYDYICSEVDCSGISANGTTGKYGDLSACDAEVKLSFLLDLYYDSIGESYACDFSGSATLKDATTQSGCSAAISQMGSLATNSVSATASFSGELTFGTGTVTEASSASGSSSSTLTTQSKSASSSGSSSSSASSTKSKNFAPSAAPGYSKILVTLLASLGVFAGISFAMI